MTREGHRDLLREQRAAKAAERPDGLKQVSQDHAWGAGAMAAKWAIRPVGQAFAQP